jgi:hypothetical protein
VADIRIGAGLSERLIQEYLALNEEAGPDNAQIAQLLAEPDPKTETPARAKRGDLLK